MAGCEGQLPTEEPHGVAIVEFEPGCIELDETTHGTRRFNTHSGLHQV